MASKKSNYWGKNAKKAVKKAHGGIVAIGILFFLIGAAAGYIGTMKLCEQDHFVLNGDKEITIEQGSAYTYREEGASIVSIGRDLSNQVKISTDLVSDENGNYLIDTSTASTYVITYTVDDIRYGEIKRIRTITVLGGEE